MSNRPYIEWTWDMLKLKPLLIKSYSFPWLAHNHISKENGSVCLMGTLPETNFFAPEIGWLEVGMLLSFLEWSIFKGFCC